VRREERRKWRVESGRRKDERSKKKEGGRK
jgi:hypothetical protein